MDSISFTSLHNIERTSKRHVEGNLTNPEANIEEIHPDRKSSSAAIANTRRAGIQYSSAQYMIKASMQAQNCADENGYDKTQYIGDLGSRKVYTATSKEDIEPAVIVSTDKDAKIYLGAESKEILVRLEEKEQKAKEHFSRYE